MCEIQSLNQFDYKTFWLYRRVYKHFKQLNLLCNFPTAYPGVSGTIASGMTSTQSYYGLYPDQVFY